MSLSGTIETVNATEVKKGISNSRESVSIYDGRKGWGIEQARRECVAMQEEERQIASRRLHEVDK